MVKGSHKPPSRIRYEQSHPTISCRLDKQTYDLLQKRLDDADLSFAQFVKSQLGILELEWPDLEEIDRKAYQEGLAEATNKYRIQIKCQRCGEPITVMPHSQMHETIKDHLEGLWHHTNCHED